MNIFYATFVSVSDPSCWKFVTKIYRAAYEEEARDNATKDWHKNFPDYNMSFYTIPYFDEFGGAIVSQVNK